MILRFSVSGRAILYGYRAQISGLSRARAERRQVRHAGGKKTALRGLTRCQASCKGAGAGILRWGPHAAEAFAGNGKKYSARMSVDLVEYSTRQRSRMIASLMIAGATLIILAHAGQATGPEESLWPGVTLDSAQADAAFPGWRAHHQHQELCGFRSACDRWGAPVRRGLAALGHAGAGLRASMPPGSRDDWTGLRVGRTAF